jgi:hypothetical protein
LIEKSIKIITDIFQINNIYFQKKAANKIELKKKLSEKLKEKETEK